MTDLARWMGGFSVGGRGRTGKANVTSFRGGKWHIPTAEYEAFLERVFWRCETFDSFFNEVAQDRSRLFLDIDSDVELNVADLRRAIEGVVNRLFPGGWRATLGFRDGSHGVHAVFPGLVVTKGVRKATMLAVSELVPQVDLGVSGLRLPGCVTTKPGSTMYMPLTADLSIHPAPGEELAYPTMNPCPNPSSVYSMLPAKGQARKKVTPMDGKAGARWMQRIRAFRPEWADLQLDKVWSYQKRMFISVKGPGKTDCLIKGAPHKNNRIWFEVDGLFYQRCHKCAGAKFSFF